MSFPLFYTAAMSMTIAGAIRQVAEQLRGRAKAEIYRSDPVLWMKERINLDLWSKQREISESLVNHKKTAVKSCFGIGKTYLAAALVCWWLDVHPPTETVVVTTAPTDSQVKKLLWEYIRKIHREHNLDGDVTENAEWKSDERDVIAYGRKPAEATMSAFQGQHVRYLLVVVDEAGGVPQMIWDGVEAITTIDTNRALVIGNPEDPNTEFGRIFLEDDPVWNKISVSAYESPNLTDEHLTLPKEMCELLTSVAWVREREKKWGLKDRRFVSKVLAEFPREATDQMFSRSMLLEAQERLIFPAPETRLVLGVDVARFGGDRTTVLSNWGGHIEIVASWDKTDTVATANLVHDIAIRHGAAEIRVDGTGVGAGVVDQLTRKEQSVYFVVEVNGSAASPDIKQWWNYRAYGFDNLRGLLHAGKIDLPVQDDSHDTPDTGMDDDEPKLLSDELEGQRYKFMRGRGSMLMESKDDIKRRGGKSPLTMRTLLSMRRCHSRVATSAPTWRPVTW